MICGHEQILEEIQRILEANDGTYNRWLSYACRLINLFLDGKKRYKYEPADIVHTIIEKLYDNKRKWDPEKYPDLRIYVFLVIRSHILNIAKNEKKFVDNEECDNEDEENMPNNFFDTNHFVSVDEVFSSRDSAELENLCMIALDGNDIDVLVFMEINSGMQNAAISDDLGLPVSEVENSKKRIKRKLKPVFEEFCNIKINNSV